MTHYLVTGGVGFIGSHLVKALLGRSARVTVVDRRSLDQSPILQAACKGTDFRFIQADLRDSDNTAELLAASKPDVVYHLAAQPLSILSNIAPLNTAQDNIFGTYSVLEAVRNHSPRSRLVYTSSACFYGVPTSAPPLRETHAPAVGHYMYTATKIAADFAVQHYRHIYDLRCVSVRMVNVYGPGDTNLGRVVPRIVMQALRGEAPTLTQSDGNDVFSFLYMDDAVAALELLGMHPSAIQKPVWNIAGSAPLSVLELMRRIYSLVGRPTDSFAAIGPRRGAPVHKYLDGTMIREELGFSPAIDLDGGLRSTIEWYRRYLSAVSGGQVEVQGARA